MTQYGLYSVVAHNQQDQTWLVRSPHRHDLENLQKLALLEAEVLETPGAVYPFRLILDSSQWERCLFALGQSVNYPSFTERIGQLPDQQHKSEGYARIARVFEALPSPDEDAVAASAAGLRPETLFARADEEAAEELSAEEQRALQELFDRGRALAEAGNHAGALEVFDQVVAVVTNSPAVHWMRGVSLCRLNRHEEGIVAFEAGLVLAPGDAQTLWNIALAFIHLRRLDEARGALVQALEAHPDFAVNAFPLLGYIAALEWDLRPPVDLQQWLHNREPGQLDLQSANSLFLLAAATLSLGQAEEARGHYESLQALDAACAAQLQPILEAVEAVEGQEKPPVTDWQAENQPLRDALERYAHLGEITGAVPGEAREIIYRSILQSWFLVPLDSPPQESADGGAQLSFHLQPLEGMGDAPVLLTFTNLDSARQFWGDRPLDRAVVPGDSLCNLVNTLSEALAPQEGMSYAPGVAAAVVIDAAGPHPFVLPLAAVQALARGEVPLE